MFHFPTFPPLTLCVQVRVTGHDSCRVSPFGNPRITARLTAPRGLSQPPTSFIGSWCQGIHRAPLLTWPQSILMLASTVQFSRYGRCRPGPVAYRRTGRPTRICPTPPRRRLSLDERRAPAGSPRFRLTQPGPSGPNSVPKQTIRVPVPFLLHEAAVLDDGAVGACQLVNVPPLSTIPGAFVRGMALDARPEGPAPGAP
jgi:hypothetical protein